MNNANPSNCSQCGTPTYYSIKDGVDNEIFYCPECLVNVLIQAIDEGYFEKYGRRVSLCNKILASDVIYIEENGRFVINSSNIIHTITIQRLPYSAISSIVPNAGPATAYFVFTLSDVVSGETKYDIFPAVTYMDLYEHMRRCFTTYLVKPENK